MQLSDIVARLDETLAIDDFADVDASVNGLQIGPDERSVEKVAFTVDAAEATIDAAFDAGADLLVVHHGLVQGGLGRVTGYDFDRIESLVHDDLALCVSHLPFDDHQELGNATGVADHLGLEDIELPGSLGLIHIGQAGSLEPPQMADEIRAALDELDGSAEATVLDFGPGEISSVGAVTGSGIDWPDEVIDRDVDVLVIGEGKQKTYHEAREVGVSVFLAGHYTTETFGVRSLCDLVDEWGLETEYVSHPIGLQGRANTCQSAARPCRTRAFRRSADAPPRMSDHDDDGHEMSDREELQRDPLGHAEVRGGMTVGELVEQYGHAGISATDVHEAADIYTEMLADDDRTVLMSLAGVTVLTGMRKAASGLICDGHVDALVTTGANLAHDAIEAIGGRHHHRRAHPDPSSFPSYSSREHGAEHHGGKTEHEYGEMLCDEEVDRIYNVYFPREHFALFESRLRSEVFPALEGEGTINVVDPCRELGRANSEVNDRGRIDEDAGIAAAAHEADVLIYRPAVQGSVLGLQVWMYSQTSSLSLDALVDIAPLIDLAYDTDAADCLLVGGGVPKNFTFQTMLVAPGAYDYGVQVMMDLAATGGLPGVTFDEACSWGKLEKGARNTTVLGDATTMLLLLVVVMRERIE